MCSSARGLIVSLLFCPGKQKSSSSFLHIQYMKQILIAVKYFMMAAFHAADN